jgi:hypothetical protein
MKRHGKHHGPTSPVFDETGPCSSQTPYLVPTHVGVQFVPSCRLATRPTSRTGLPARKVSRGAWWEFPTASAPSTTATAP